MGVIATPLCNRITPLILACKNVSCFQAIMLRVDGDDSIEKSADMSELRLQSIVVRSVLPH